MIFGGFDFDFDYIIAQKARHCNIGQRKKRKKSESCPVLTLYVPEVT